MLWFERIAMAVELRRIYRGSHRSLAKAGYGFRPSAARPLASRAAR